MAAHGITARTSRPATWTQCRQRGGDAAVGSLVVVDLGATDALTTAYDSRTPGAVSSPGTQTAASGPYATVIPATAGLASGRVGVVVGRAVSDDQLGSYELGELGDGGVAPIEVDALVLVGASAVSGAVLGVTTSGGSAVLGAGVAGGAWATLLEDATTGSGAVLRRVLLAGDGVAASDAPPLSINAQTGTTYTLALSDRGKIITLSNASAITLTVPPAASVAFPAGTEIALMQVGAGTVTVAPGSGVAINSLGSVVDLAGQYAVATLVQTATNTWTLFGGIA